MSAPLLHRVYLRAPPDAPGQALLRFLEASAADLRAMGVSLRVESISDRLAANPAVVAAFAAKGVSALPALITPSGTYVGLVAIHRLYEKNLAAFRAAGGAEAEEDPLDNFYRKMGLRGEPGGGGGGGDGDEDEPREGDVGEGGGRLMDDVQRFVARRQELLGPRAGGGGPGAGAGAGGPGGGARAPARGTPARGGAPPPREDNVRHPEDDEFKAMIATLAGSIDEGLRAKAFDPAARPADDTDCSHLDSLMESQYYSRIEPSD